MKANLFEFYIYCLDKSLTTYAFRRWELSPRDAHLLVLRKAKKERGSAFVRLETFHRDDQGILRCYLTDVRCVDKEATSQPDQGTRT